MKPAAASTLADRRAFLAAILGGSLASLLTRTGLHAAEVAQLAGDISRVPTTGFAGGAARTSWLKFEMPDFRRVIVPGRINGRQAQILLDSGINGVILNEDFAATLGLREIGGITGVGVTGSVHGRVLEGVRISFDNLTVATAKSELYDFTPFAGVLNEPISALLGSDLFESLIVDLDFANARIAFQDAHHHESLTNGYDLPLRRDKFGLRSVAISLEDRPAIQATLDMGSDRPLNIASAYAADQNLLMERRFSTTLSSGFAGAEEGKVAMLSKLSLGDISFHEVPFEVPGAWTFQNPAIVGMPVIRRMRMLIDFPHDRVHAAPDARLMLQPFRKDRSGLGARRLPDRLQIMHVAAGSPAAAAGLRAGDEIIAINDQALDAAYFRKHPRDGSQPAGTAFYFTLANHATVKLVLADYY